MGSYGWHNPWPFEWGGGETEDERVYEAMRSAVGSLAAVDDSGLDGLWRQCRAEIYATVGTFPERAILQAFPQCATDHLPLWEDYLGLVPTATATDEDRRADVVAAYTRRMLADGPNLALQLKAIDPRFAVLTVPPNRSTVCVLGYPYADSPPNYASDFCVPVMLDAGPVVPGAAEELAFARARRLLAECLPAWVTYARVSGFGFVLGRSPLGITVLA